MYLSWAALFEGNSDQNYFEVLLPRLLEEIIRTQGTRDVTVPSTPAVVLKRQSIDNVAREACEASDAFHMVFIHGDTGGRGLQRGLDNRTCSYCSAINNLCAWPLERCIVLAPKHETEAWLLADPAAVAAALGYSGQPASLGLPQDAQHAERLSDPKHVLATAIKTVRRGRSSDPSGLYAAIAQRQSLANLRQSASFANFEAALKVALRSLGCLP
jgi:hypothetical protein